MLLHQADAGYAWGEGHAAGRASVLWLKLCGHEHRLSYPEPGCLVCNMEMGLLIIDPWRDLRIGRGCSLPLRLLSKENLSVD